LIQLLAENPRGLIVRFANCSRLDKTNVDGTLGVFVVQMVQDEFAKAIASILKTSDGGSFRYVFNINIAIPFLVVMTLLQLAVAWLSVVLQVRHQQYVQWWFIES
jgi:hypothetical protein